MMMMIIKSDIFIMFMTNGNKMLYSLSCQALFLIVNYCVPPMMTFANNTYQFDDEN